MDIQMCFEMTCPNLGTDGPSVETYALSYFRKFSVHCWFLYCPEGPRTE